MISPTSPKKLASYAHLLAPCALLALGAFARELPMPRALAPSVIEFGGAAAQRDNVLAASQTMVVQAKKSAGSTLLSSRLEAAGVTARAPMSGQIARVMVRAGEFVQVNDRILQISTRGATLVDPGAQRATARAESSQVAAAQDQTALQSRMSSAHTRLEESQARVARARARVLAAQNIVEELKNGGLREAEPARETRPDQSAARREYSRASSAVSSAAAQAEKSAAAATSAQNAAREALREAEQAEKIAAQKPRKSAESSDAKTSAAPSGEGAAKEKSDAPAPQDNSAANEAAGRAAVSARRKADRLQGEARAAQRAAERDQNAARDAERLKNSLNLPLFGGASGGKKAEQPPASTRERAANKAYVSVADAARMVQSAQDESLAAIAQARRLKNEVERYDNQLSETQQRINSSGQQMETAQQRLMDNTIRARLSVVRAPTSGTVLWVAPLASEVEDGERIVTVGSRRRLLVSFEDTSGAWKNLRDGALLPALAYPAGKDVQGVSVTVKLQEVEAPRREGAAATLTGSVIAASAATRLKAGMRIACSLDKPGKRSIIMVPSSAIRRGANGDEIAVLKAQDSTASEANVEANAASTRETQSVPDAPDASYLVEWRRVVTGSSDGVRHEVRQGLMPGERIVLQPALLGDETAPRLVRLRRD